MFSATTKLDATCHSQPRPTVLLTCADNIMPLSWHMPISKEPFRYAICVRDENYSYDLLHKHREFALNFLDYSYVEAHQKTGSLHGKGINKFKESGLSKKSGMSISSKLIKEAYMIYECSVIDILNYGDHDVFIANVNIILNKQDKEVSPTLFMGRGVYETTSKNPTQLQR